MGETAQYTTIKRIVLDYQDAAFQNVAQYRRLKKLAIRGLKELKMDAIGYPKTCRLCVNANKTVDLPEDYMVWSKVGVLNATGEVNTLRHNTDLSVYAAGSPDRLSKNTDFTSGIDLSFRTELFYLNFWDNGYGYYGGYHVYGVPGSEISNMGDFKIDEEAGVIILDNYFPEDYIMLEYLAAPSNDEDSKVPSIASECLIAWIGWKDIEFLAASRKVSIYDKTQRRKEYFNQKRLLQQRRNPFRVQEGYDIIARSIRLVPKG